MQRIIITGANGAGKSHPAARLARARPDVPVVSFDALKLTTHWQERPRLQIDADLRAVVDREAWILEGGPSLLPLALPRAKAVIWLDPPLAIRAWRLVLSPLVSRCRTRPELPPGNPDRLIRQYRFAWASLRREAQFRRRIIEEMQGATVPFIACHTRVDADSAVALWRNGAS